jgi:hypothetical protein
MPFERVQFEFPNPDKIENQPAVEGEDDIKIVIDGPDSPLESASPPQEPEKQAEKAVEIEVIDDTPKEDQGKKQSKPPDEITEEELESYSEKTRKRIKHFSKGFHDQRRIAEAAQREKDEALRVTKQLMEENKQLKGTVSKNQEVLLAQAKKEVTGEINVAKYQYKQAYEAGDSDAIIKAQEDLTSAKIKADKINNFTLPPVQTAESSVEQQTIAPQMAVDSRALDWQKDNPWFGPDDEMTHFALGLHQKLVKQGVSPQSDEYYEKINSRMRQIFPDNFEGTEEAVEPAEPRRRNVVAPVTRSVAPRKITLTKTQVALARRLGLPLELYAKQVVEDMRKQNG